MLKVHQVLDWFPELAKAPRMSTTVPTARMRTNHEAIIARLWIWQRSEDYVRTAAVYTWDIGEQKLCILRTRVLVFRKARRWWWTTKAGRDVQIVRCDQRKFIVKQGELYE